MGSGKGGGTWELLVWVGWKNIIFIFFLLEKNKNCDFSYSTHANGFQSFTPFPGTPSVARSVLGIT